MKAVKEIDVPNTTIVLRKFEVTYIINADSPEDAEVLLESGVSSDRLRIFANEVAEDDGFDATITAYQAKTASLKNEATGSY